MDDRKPTSEEIGIMAEAACEAAMDKAKELGLHWVWHIAGIERAYNATMGTIMLCEKTGYDGVVALAEALKKIEMYDMMVEAEEAINGKQD